MKGTLTSILLLVYQHEGCQHQIQLLLGMISGKRLDESAKRFQTRLKRIKSGDKLEGVQLPRLLRKEAP